MVACTFFGHRDCPGDVKDKLREVLRELILQKKATVFYVGNQGNFDSIVLSVLREMKKEYSDIIYYVVLAYMPTERKTLDVTEYDETIYPEGLEKTPRKFAIAKRNRWMIERSDFVITYVIHSVGGAAQFEKIAVRKNKQVINLGA